MPERKHCPTHRVGSDHCINKYCLGCKHTSTATWHITPAYSQCLGSCEPASWALFSDSDGGSHDDCRNYGGDWTISPNV